MSAPFRKQYDVIILGAGISGLALYQFLKRDSPHLSIGLLEKSHRAGGWINTFRSPSGQVYELGPRTLLVNQTAPGVSHLIDGRVTLVSSAKERFVLLDGELVKFPTSIFELIGSSFGRVLLGAKVRDLFKTKASAADASTPDESVQDFFVRRFGKKAGRILSQTLVTGIYAADPSQLSIRLAFRECWEAEKKTGRNILRALYQSRKNASMIAFPSGFQEFIQSVTPANCVYGAEVLELIEERNQVTIVTSLGEFHAKYAVSTLPTYALKRLLPPADPYQVYLNIPYASLTTVSLGYKQEGVVPAGFGYLNAHPGDLLGVVYDSSVFPELSFSMKSRATVMLRLCKGLSDAEIVAKTCKMIGYPLPDEWFVQHAKNAIPTWPVGYHLDPLMDQTQMRRLKVSGSWISGVSVPSCIQRAEQVSSELQKLF